MTGNITLKLISNIVETNFSKLNASGNGNANYSSVTLYPTVSGLSISGDLGASLIEFVGCKNVIIDGRVNQIGVADLTISNTGTSVSSSKTFYFHDGASDNVIRYCNIKGANSGSSGAIISFETSIDVAGNNNNTIEYCNITNSGSRPTIALLSAGTAGKENTGNIISNNNFYDFFSSSESYTSFGIFISTNSSDWTISGNSFYETTDFSPIVNNYFYAIRISTGNNHIVSNNYIGGKSPQCGGSPMSVNLNATTSSTFYGIYLSVGATTASSIQNNVIKNINLTTAVTNTLPFCGIYVGSGKVNVGTTTGNSIGASEGTGSIVLTNTNLNTNPSVGISINGSDNVSVDNNNIGSITLLGSTAVNHNFRGIASYGTGVISIKNNSIGSSTTPNSIVASSSAITSTNPQYLYGISNDGNGILTIANNTIANLHNAYGGTLTSSQTIGINILNGTRGANTIESNTIRNLSNASPQNNSYTTASVVGISQRSTVSNQVITKNKIYNLNNTATGSVAVGVFGIFYTGGTTGTNSVSKNFIQNLTASSTSASAVITGIRIDTGVTTYSNNIISLGTGISTGYTMYGIYEPGTVNNNCNLYFNTVYIGGNATGGSNTFALYNNSNSNTRNIRNNIFFNARSNASGNAKHYAIRLTGNTNLTINYNDYFANGSGGVLGNYNSADKTDLTSWRTSTSQDVNSVNTTPDLSSAGGTNELDYKPNEGSFFAAANGTGITTDYSDYSRQSTPCIGAYEQRLFVEGSISFCAGSNNASFTLIGPNLSVIKWQKSADAITWSDIANTSSTYNATNVTVTTYYRAIVLWNVNSTANSSIATLTVSLLSVGGTISGSTPVCAGTNSTSLTLSGYTGTIVKWQSSVNNVAWSDISNTSINYTASNLTTSTYFRAVVQSGVCASANSTTVLVTVNPLSVGGSVSGGGTLCSSTNSTLLTLSGNIGTVVKWQSSPYGTVWTDIANTNTTYTVTNQNNTMYYRAVVQSGSCSIVYSSSSAISVILSVGGTLTGAATVCAETNSKLLTLTGEIGDVLKWQSSVNNTDWTDIENLNTTYTATNLMTTTYFRVVVQSDICSFANSNSTTIAVNALSNGGTVLGGTSVCTGSNNSTLLTLTDKTGTIVKWQSSLNSIDWNDITNNNAAYTAVNLTTTTHYRAVVKSGVCSSANSIPATVIVDPTSIGGTITGGATICSGSTSGLLTLTGNTGNVVRWESSVSPFSTWTPIVNTTSTYTSGALTETTQFRAVVQSGVCSSANSAITTRTIIATTWNGTLWTNGEPTSASSVIYTGNAAIGVDMSACSITVTNNAVVSVTSGFSVTLSGAVTVAPGSQFTLNNNANLIQNGIVNENSGDIIVKRNSNALKRLDYTMWSSPVSGPQTMSNFSPLTNSGRFYEYNSATNYYNPISGTTTFSKGKGFLIRMPNTDQLAGYYDGAVTLTFVGQFIGVPNNGDVSISSQAGQYVAVGNPYPTTVNADAFINENGITELYLWRKTNNSANPSYATYTTAGGTSNSGGESSIIPNGILQVGQGFITKAVSSTLNFSNAMKTNDRQNQILKKAAVERNRIWLNLTSDNDVFSQTLIAYMTNATQGIDTGIDGKFFSKNGIEISSLIDNQEFAIQGRSLPFESTDVVPLVFKTNLAGSYTFAIEKVDGFFAENNQEIYLKDNLNNTINNLRTGAYTFTAEKGDFMNRFEIVYQKNTLGVSSQDFINNQVLVNKVNGSINFIAKLEIIKTIEIFDSRGRLLQTQKNVNNSSFSILAPSANGVLLVKVTLQNNRIEIKKIAN